MVRGRRSFVTGLAALAAAGPALSQTFTATSISQAAQDARRDVGVLSRRAADLLRATAADGYERGGNAVRRFRSDGASLARELAAVFNGRVSEDDWLLVVPTSELDLALAMRPLLIRLAPTKDQVEAALKQPLPQLEGQNVELGTAEDVLLAIVLACLDVPRGKELMARLRSDSALDAALQAATAAIKAHRYGLAALELERLMRVVVLPRNIATISDTGSSTRSLYRSLSARFVPFIGWGYFDAMLLATVYLNRDTTAPVLR